jgi:hypothetical protein
MPAQAQISSIEALEAFRSDLIIFLGQLPPVLDETSGELVRMRFWLQNEQREFWENQARRRRRKLEEAQAELFNARLSTLRDSTLLPQMAVHKAQRAVEEAEEKLAALKKWDRELDNLAEPLVKQVEQLRDFLTTDMTKAVAYLTQVIQSLEAYTNVASPATPRPSAAPADDKKNSP